MVENKEKTFCPFYEPNPFCNVTGKCVHLKETPITSQNICGNRIPGEQLWEVHYCPHEKSIKNHLEVKKKNREKWIKYHEERREKHD